MTRPKKQVIKKARRVVKNKFKVSKSFAKRFSSNSNGVMKANSAGRRHNASNRDATQHLSSKGTFIVDKVNVKCARRMMGEKSSFRSSHYVSETQLPICSKKIAKFISLLKQCQE